MFWKYDAGPDDSILRWHQYAAVSDLMHNWVAQTLDFKSALRVVRMVLNTQCYQYLWLAMWFHVKKIGRNTQKIKIADFTMWIRLPSSEMTKKRQKNGSLNRDLLNFLYRYGIFWMPPGESSHPGGSEYVWQRGVEGVLGRVTGGRSLPYFQRKNQLKWAVEKNKHGHNFQNIASKTNLRGLIVYEPTLIQFGADILKIVAVSVFFYGS